MSNNTRQRPDSSPIRFTAKHLAAQMRRTDWPGRRTGVDEAALAAKKASGAILGNPSNLRLAGSNGRASLVEAADRFPEGLMPNRVPLAVIGHRIQPSGLKSARGGKWHPSSVANLFYRVA